MPVIQQPEAYIGGAGDLFDERKPQKRRDAPSSCQIHEEARGFQLLHDAARKRGAGLCERRCSATRRHHIAEVKMNGDDKLIPMKLRITELFRLREGAWKLIHRHADLAAGVRKDE